MTFASGNLLRTAMVVEATPGVAPATPSFTTSRVTKASGGSKKQTSVSEEMAGSRNIRSVILEGIDVDVSYDFELTYATWDVVLESLLQSTWTTNVLKVGSTRKYFTIEEADLTGTSAFNRYLGSIADEFSISAQVRKKITGTAKFMAMQEQLDAAVITGATYAAPNTNAVMTAAAAIGSLSLTGLTAQPKIKSIDLNIKNSLGRREQLGSLYTLEPSSNPIEVTGTLMAYFESIELYQAALAHQTVGLSCHLGLAAGSRYQIDIPVCRLVDSDRQRNSYRDDVMVQIQFQGELDNASGSTIKITRAV